MKLFSYNLTISRCESEKCAHECRNNREWEYAKVVSSDDDSDNSEEAAPVKAKATPAKAAAKKEKSSEP